VNSSRSPYFAVTGGWGDPVMLGIVLGGFFDEAWSFAVVPRCRRVWRQRRVLGPLLSISLFFFYFLFFLIGLFFVFGFFWCLPLSLEEWRLVTLATPGPRIFLVLVPDFFFSFFSVW